MYQSVQKGEAISLQKIETFVNGLAPPYAGKNAFQVVKKYVDEIILVEDDQVKDAMKLLYNEQKVVVESAGNLVQIFTRRCCLCCCPFARKVRRCDWKKCCLRFIRRKR